MTIDKIHAEVVVKAISKSMYFICLANDRFPLVVPREVMLDIISKSGSRKIVDNVKLMGNRDGVSKFLVDDGYKSVISKQGRFVHLYHVSFKDLGELAVFKPRIPANGAGSEDKVKPRVCFSTSLGGAISAIPDGPDMISDKPIYVYECFICKEDINFIDYTRLYKSGSVPDALATGECWYCNNIILKRNKVTITNWEDTYKIIMDESEREKLYNIILRVTNINPSYLDRFRFKTVYDLVNNILAKDKKIGDYYNNIINELDAEELLVIQNIETK